MLLLLSLEVVCVRFNQWQPLLHHLRLLLVVASILLLLKPLLQPLLLLTVIPLVITVGPIRVLLLWLLLVLLRVAPCAVVHLLLLLVVGALLPLLLSCREAATTAILRVRLRLLCAVGMVLLRPYVCMVLVMRVCWAAIAAGQQGAAQRLQQQADDQHNTVSGSMGESCRMPWALWASRSAVRSCRTKHASARAKCADRIGRCCLNIGTMKCAHWVVQRKG